MDQADWRELIRTLKWSALVGLIIFAIAWAMMAWIDRAHAHDWQKPNLDGWYSSLRRPGMDPNFNFSCCSKSDCHETEAEMRGGDWWARLGRQKTVEGGLDWELQDWIKVPAEVVLQHQSNPTGNAVICHSMVLDPAMHVSQQSTVYCFVPPTES